jgi:sugar phosphate isomerase/epimerase
MPNHVIVSTLNWSEQSLEQAVANVAALDFGQIDLALHEGWAHVDPSDLARGPDRIKQQADRINGLISMHQMKRVAAFNVGLKEGDRADHRRRLAAVCDLARALDVSVLTLMSAPWGSPVEAEAERLKSLLPIAQERGVQLTVQTHYQQVTATAGGAVQLCELVPGLGVTLDPSHLYAGPNQGADYATVLPFVRLVHLRDATVKHLQVPAGTGSVDFGWLVERLHALDYEGKFAIKYVDRVPTTVLTEGTTDIAENVIRMRDVFVGAERAKGIVRGASPAAATSQ